jgi:hypothetical protein
VRARRGSDAADRGGRGAGRGREEEGVKVEVEAEVEVEDDALNGADRRGWD